MTNDFNYKEVNNLTEEEKKYALKILEELSKNGSSKTYDNILYADYREIPVDIETFITDDKYLGRAWKDSTGKLKMYPYWMDVLKKLFPTNIDTSVNNLIESGARGLGKSEIAAGAVSLYLMYRVLCLKNPLEHFGLKPTEKICFAYMNIKLELAEDIGISKLQKTVQLSPWFMSKGTMSQKNGRPYWTPPDPIQIIIGSQSSDVIGQPIYFCLDGDTEIVTSDGVFQIKTLVDKTIQVPTVNSNGKLEISDECTVKPTMVSNVEYEIELEDGTVIKCTPNHRFMLKDGTYKEAQYLTADDELFDIDRYGYIYKTTNLINGKIYIGQKKSSIFLNEGYLGSGKLLKSAIDKYGRDKFHVELLCWCCSKESLNNMEKIFILKYGSTDKNIGYNIANGGQGGDLGKDVSNTIAKKLTGHVTSDLTKTKISNSLKGKHLSDEQKHKISVGNKGKKLSEETKNKMSASAKKLDRSNRRTNKNKIAVSDGTNVRYISPETEIPNGWYKGNVKASNPHDMTHYYSSEENRLKNRLSKIGSKNSMYHNGYKICGGNNGKALTDYWYNDMYFDCRKSLVEYLKTIDESITLNLIRSIENNTYKSRVKNKYQWLISSLRWKKKDEN